MKRKEILIVIAIIAITIIVAFIPRAINEGENSPIETNANNLITITVGGEINVLGDGVGDDSISNEMVIIMPKGCTYGEVLNKILNYLTKYSILDNDLKKRYYDDSIIIIKSSYVNNDIDDALDTDGKICISTASLDELVKLYGIGEKRAKMIIEYRENNVIDSFELLQSIIGVSDAVIEIIKEKAFL